jgi:hypothetical protein
VRRALRRGRRGPNVHECDPRRREEKKKLTDAARRWAAGDGGGQAGNDEVASDLQALGIEGAEEWLEEQEPEPFAVLPENAQSVELFLLSSTQWRFAEGLPVSLDYPGVEAAARLAGIAMTPELFADIRIMERAAVEAMRERRKP